MKDPQVQKEVTGCRSIVKILSGDPAKQWEGAGGYGREWEGL